MGDAFDALNSLSADDFDDLVPLSSSSGSDAAGPVPDATPEELQVYIAMQSELAAKGDSGLYGEILGDMGDESSVAGLSIEDRFDVLDNADGIGASGYESGVGFGGGLTTADVANDILNQPPVEPTLNMEDFMSQAVSEAINEVKSDAQANAFAVDRALEEADLRREIENIFDDAGDKLRLEVEEMRKEQYAVTQASAEQGELYVQSEKERLSEAEASVSRLIKKVSDNTNEVERAMVDLEQARTDLMTKEGGGMGDAASDLKKGGLVKQAALVGGLLFGSRAFTEGILVFGGGFAGEAHLVPAAVQLVIALACGAYLVFVK